MLAPDETELSEAEALELLSEQEVSGAASAERRIKADKTLILKNFPKRVLSLFFMVGSF